MTTGGESPPPRLAVVGCGGAGLAHLGALERAGLGPTAVVDNDPTVLARVADRWPRVVTAQSLGPVTDEFDAAIVAVPDLAHRAVTTELLIAGKDVLVEKPMEVTRESAQAMAATAASSGRLLAVAHMRRHLSGIGAAFDLISSGRLGVVRSVDLAHGGLDRWLASSSGYVTQAAGGVIADQGSHSIDLLSWLFGPLKVLSCTDDARGGREADAVVELLAGAVPIHLEISRIRSKRNTLRVETERGQLEVALDHYQPKQVVVWPEGMPNHPLEPASDTFELLFDRQLQAFSAALAGRWPPSLATAADGVGVAGVIEDCYARRRLDEPYWMRSAVTGVSR